MGQRVYLRDHSHRGRNKIQDAWAPEVFVVVRSPAPGEPVYVVAPQGQPTGVRHIHRNMLKPIPCSAPQSPVNRTVPRAVSPDIEGGFWVARQRPSELVTGPVLLNTGAGAAIPPIPTSELTLTTGPNHLDPPAPRRSTRPTAGRHTNPYRLPLTARSTADRATTSQVMASSSAP